MSNTCDVYVKLPHGVIIGHEAFSISGLAMDSARMVLQHGFNENVDRAAKGLVTLEFISRFRADVDEAIRALGPCLVRTAPGDDRPLYVFRCFNGGGDETLHSPNVHLNVRRSGLVVLTGADEDGRQYGWNRDVLTVGVGELATLESHDSQRFQRVLESLPPPDYSKPALKRRKAMA